MYRVFEKAMQEAFSGEGVVFDARRMFDQSGVPAQSAVAAWLLALGGDKPAREWLQQASARNIAAAFCLKTLALAKKEIETAVDEPCFRGRLERLSAHPCKADALRDLFFPEGAGLPEQREEQALALRRKR